jgi:hypothetical protein
MARPPAIRIEELATLPEHLSSPPVFSGARVTRSLVLCVRVSGITFIRFAQNRLIYISNKLISTDYWADDALEG